MKIFCDFDGTITNRDSIVFLTERYGGGSVFRRRILEEIQSGKLSVFEAIESELASVKIGWEEAVKGLTESIQIDPDFPAFVLWCRNQDFPLTVVSSGIRPVINLFIEEWKLPVYAHEVEPDPSGWRYKRLKDQEKLVIVQKAMAEGQTAYIGDGASDVKVAPLVDLLFARRGFYLAHYCQTEGIPFVPFSSFRDVQEHLSANLAGPTN